ncbi:hypothetical protein JHK82_047948 [Glycine max]|nr:hypothetical protein JHK82_047948 [Glycine max]
MIRCKEPLPPKKVNNNNTPTFSIVGDHNPFQLSGEDKTTINPQPSTFFFLDYHHPSSLITSRHCSFFIVRPRLPSLIVRKRGLRMVDIEVQTQSQVIQADSEGEADPTYSPSYLSGDDDIYLDDETLASFMSKKKSKRKCATSK